MSKMNLFAEAAIAATTVTAPRLYGDVTEISENEYQLQYAEALNVAHSMNTNMRIHAESMTPMVEKMGALGAFLYTEAEGGFFKRILDALIKLFEKVKGFFGALLRRFKGNKSYRDDLATLQAAAKSSMQLPVLDAAVLKIPKHRWEALVSIVKNLLKKDSIVFGEKYDGTNIAGVIGITKKLIADLSTMVEDQAEKDTTTDSAQGIKKTFEYIKSNFTTPDMWVKHMLGVAVGKASLGEANFNPKSPKTALENVSMLWSTETEDVKGVALSSGGNNVKYYTEFLKNIALLNIDDILPALEEGETFFKEKTEELKENLKELETLAKQVDTNSEDTGARAKKIAQDAGNLTTTYSSVLSDYSTMAITTFNMSKSVFEKLLSEGKKITDSMDALIKKHGINPDYNSGTK